MTVITNIPYWKAHYECSMTNIMHISFKSMVNNKSPVHCILLALSDNDKVKSTLFQLGEIKWTVRMMFWRITLFLIYLILSIFIIHDNIKSLSSYFQRLEFQHTQTHTCNYQAVAQLVECLLGKWEVVGWTLTRSDLKLETQTFITI